MIREYSRNTSWPRETEKIATTSTTNILKGIKLPRCKKERKRENKRKEGKKNDQTKDLSLRGQVRGTTVEDRA